MDVNRVEGENITMISSYELIPKGIMEEIDKISRNISATIVDELEEFYAQNPEYLDMITEGYFGNYQEI
ncbi:MAG: hypothetical protein IJW73_09550 [Candidatus Gastranaerophilales bacterium]|nr:hypothetical protein [Candidatus Gastranaerophilales bacterium]